MFVIEYDSDSTVNGSPVGTVFVLHCPRIAPDVYSYTKDPRQATQYPTRQAAEAVALGKAWPKARVLEAP